MLARFQKLRLLSVLLLLAWVLPFVLSGAFFTEAQKPSIDVQQSVSVIEPWQTDANVLVVSSRCHKCPFGSSDSSLQCSGQMLAAQVTSDYAYNRAGLLYAMPKEWDAIAREFAPDPPPPRLV